MPQNLDTFSQIGLFEKHAPTPMFLAGFFRSPAQNYQYGEKITWDSVRTGRSVATVRGGPSSDPQRIAVDRSVNNEVAAPDYSVSFTLTSEQLRSRAPGENPFQNRAYRARLAGLITRNAALSSEMIVRAMEQQASQVLTNGALSLTDEFGRVRFSQSFGLKATHFTTASTLWSAGGSTPLADLEAKADVIHLDSLVSPDILIFGKNAASTFLSHSTVTPEFDNRRIERGEIKLNNRGADAANWLGRINIGTYQFQCYTYAAFFENAQTGARVPYVADNDVLMLTSGAQLDMYYSYNPNIGDELGVSKPTIPELQPRMSSPSTGMDISVNPYFSTNRKNLIVDMESRFMAVPTDGDSFGRLRVLA